MDYWRSFPLQLTAVLCLLLVYSALPAPTHARVITNRPIVDLKTSPVTPSAALPAGVPSADVAVIPDGPADDSVESLLGDTSKLQLTAEVASAASLVNVTLPVAQRFQAWARKFGKKYSGAAERVKRMLVFAANLAFIEAYHVKHPNTRLKLNEFSDLTNEEFKAAYVAPRNGRFNLLHWLKHNGGTEAHDPLVNGSSAASGKAGLLGVSQIPSSFDWRAYGVVARARNQKLPNTPYKCGECLPSALNVAPVRAFHHKTAIAHSPGHCAADFR